MTAIRDEMRIGITITIRNEAPLIRANLLYHRFLGVEAFYIYMDGTTDHSMDCICDLPNVMICPSVPPDRYLHRPELKPFVERWADLFTARQSLNTCHAITMARQRGLTWIIALDADELLCVELQHAGPSRLSTFLESVPADVDTVRFRTLEVFQRRFEYTHVFSQETLFKRWNSRIRRPIYDPFEDKIRRLEGFYGHDSGKSALRLTVDAVPRTSHEFVSRDGGKLASRRAGFLLHYNCYDFGDFIKKHRNFIDHPNTYIHGNKVDYLPKLLWRDMVNSPDFTKAYLGDYFRKWVMFSENDIQRLRRKRYFGFIPGRRPLLEVVSVKKAFEQMTDFLHEKE